MPISLLLFISYFLRFLSLLCVCLIAVPLLFPLTALITVIIISLSFGLGYQAKQLQKKFTKQEKKRVTKLIHKSRRVCVHASRLSTIALITSFLFYAILRLHITVCYLGSLDKELNPVKEDFRRVLRQPDKD